jgi:glycosyltransferase involved in cell wall biosynthesis
MLRRIAERARAVVVHNSAAADAVRRHAPAARIVEIPHLFHPPALPSLAETLRFRESLGIPQAAFLFGVFGFLRESKRLISVLQAFSQLHRERPETALLLAGQFVSSDLERAVAPWLTAGGIVRLPYLPEGDFWRAASAVDACINLRYPGAGETSGIAIRLMGIGKPVLLSDGPEIGDFPEDSCLRIPHGVAEHDSLRLHMALLASMRGVALAVGERAARHIQARHDVVQAGEQYWNLLSQASA